MDIITQFRNTARRLFPPLLIITIPIFNAWSQPRNTFVPYGKPFALVFSNVNYSFNKEGASKAFGLTRAYLGYEYFFGKNFSSKVNIDIADPGVGKLQMTAFIKNAFVQYKIDAFSARIGMICTDQFTLQEKQWGYRYILKSFQDEFNFGPSADLGAAIEYSPFQIISFDISVLNGEGYKRIQSDSIFKTSLGLTLKPFKGFFVRSYFDYMKKEYAQISAAFFAGFTFRKFKAGAEYNIQKNNSMINDHCFSGYSLYTSVGFTDNFSLFTRYDYLKSKISDLSHEPWNIDKDGKLFIAGIDYTPVTGIRVAASFLGLLPENQSKSFTSTFALNIEIKL